MSKKTIDIVANGVTSQQEIVVENAIGADVGAIAPARSIQIGGKLAASDNPLPVSSLGLGLPDEVAASTDSANSGLTGLIKRLLTRLTILFQGVAGTPNTNVITVQGIASGTPQPSLITDGTNSLSIQTTSADALPTGSRLPNVATLLGFNGTTFDRLRSGVIGAISSVLGFLNVLPAGRYNLTPPTLTDGQFLGFQINQNGDLKVTRVDTTLFIDSTLTALGATSARPVSGYRHYCYQLTISGIGTSVSIRPEGTLRSSPTATDWYSLLPANELLTYNANGTYRVLMNDQLDVSVRLNLTSIVGGTPTINVVFVAGN